MFAQRWTVEKANKWYEINGPFLGANYNPANAINQLEMWQKETFDPETIDKELQLAENLGMNSMRVFLHHLVWEQNRKHFFKVVDKYLEIADSHGIRTMFVIFDDCWNPVSKLGKQPDPKPRVHNSGWVQDPGAEILKDKTKCAALETYVKDVITRYKDDKRVVIWDLYNEPTNRNAGSYGEAGSKRKQSIYLLNQTFKWAREINPSQPLTVGIWTYSGIMKNPSGLLKICWEQSDLISFHNYSKPDHFEMQVKNFSAANRPLICTEYMARPASTFAGVLPVMKKYNVSGYNWGFVAGKSQTNYPWNSWKKQYTKESEPWFHDIYRCNYEPYDDKEIEVIKKHTAKKK